MGAAGGQRASPACLTPTGTPKGRSPHLSALLLILHSRNSPRLPQTVLSPGDTKVTICSVVGGHPNLESEFLLL